MCILGVWSHNLKRILFKYKYCDKIYDFNIMLCPFSCENGDIKFSKYNNLVFSLCFTQHGPSNMTGNINISKTPSMFPPLHGFLKK